MHLLSSAPAQVTGDSCRSLSETLTKKNKGSNVKAFMVKNYLSVFVNCMIENPAFDSQVTPVPLVHVHIVNYIFTSLDERSIRVAHSEAIVEQWSCSKGRKCSRTQVFSKKVDI